MQTLYQTKVTSTYEILFIFYIFDINRNIVGIFALKRYVNFNVIFSAPL